MLLTLSLSALIGLLLGLLGGGGSILTVPMLVYLLHVGTKAAIVTSFVVVGMFSLLALIARRHSVCWKSGVFFGLTGMLCAFGGGRFAGQLSGEVLMTLFGLVCLLTGLFMLRRGKQQPTLQFAGKSLVNSGKGRLRRVFALLVVLVACYILSQSITLHLMAIVELWLLKPWSAAWAVAGLLLLWLVLRIGGWIHKTDAIILSHHQTTREK